MYHLVKNHVRKLKDLPPDVDELAVEYVEGFNPIEGENAPLLGSRQE